MSNDHLIEQASHLPCACSRRDFLFKTGSGLGGLALSCLLAQERAFADESVAEGATNEEQAGEDEGIGIDDPLQVGRARSEVLLERGEGHVQPGHRHHDHNE